MSTLKDFLRVNINEHSLFDDNDSKEVTEFLNDKKLILDTFYINFIGFLSLLQMDHHEKVTQYFKKDKKLQIRSITSENNDISYILKIISDKGYFTTRSITQITKLLFMIKSGKIKDVDENKIRDILQFLKIDQHKPNAKIKTIVSKFISSEETILLTSLNLYKYARKNKISIEFTDIFRKTAKFKNVDLDAIDLDDKKSKDVDTTINIPDKADDSIVDVGVTKPKKKLSKKAQIQAEIDDEDLPTLNGSMTYDTKERYQILKSILGKSDNYRKSIMKLYALKKEDFTTEYFEEFYRDRIKLTKSDLDILNKIYAKKNSYWYIKYYIIFTSNSFAQDKEAHDKLSTKQLDVYNMSISYETGKYYRKGYQFSSDISVNNDIRERIYEKLKNENSSDYYKFMTDWGLLQKYIVDKINSNSSWDDAILFISMGMLLSNYIQSYGYATLSNEEENLINYISDHAPQLLIKTSYKNKIKDISIFTIDEFVDFLFGKDYDQNQLPVDMIEVNKTNYTWDIIFEIYNGRDIVVNKIVKKYVQTYYNSLKINSFLEKFDWKFDNEFLKDGNKGVNLENIDIILSSEKYTNVLDCELWIDRLSESNSRNKINILKEYIIQKKLHLIVDKFSRDMYLSSFIYELGEIEVNKYYSNIELLELFQKFEDFGLYELEKLLTLLLYTDDDVIDDKECNIIYNWDMVKDSYNSNNIFNYAGYITNKSLIYYINKKLEDKIDDVENNDYIKNLFFLRYLVDEGKSEKALEIFHKYIITIEAMYYLHEFKLEFIFSVDIIKNDKKVSDWIEKGIRDWISSGSIYSINHDVLIKEKFDIIKEEFLKIINPDSSELTISMDKSDLDIFISVVENNKEKFSDDELNLLFSNPRIFKEIRNNATFENLLKEGISIREDIKIQKKDFDAMLKFNNIDINTRLLRKKKNEKPLDYLARSSKVTDIKLPDVQIDEVEETEAERMTQSYKLYDKYHSHGRHGNTTFKILKTYNVNLPTEEFDQFRLDNPDSVMKPGFHGTGDIGAAFILRTGFAVLPSSDRSVTGRMLGDGIYFSDVIDKVQQYVGDNGMTRNWGSKGYVFEMDVNLGVEGEDYEQQSQGLVSAEWVVKNANKQLKILKAYRVELVSPSYIEQFKPNINESLETAKQLLEKKMKTSYYKYTFIDGKIPISKNKSIDFEDVKLLDKRVRIDYSQNGPVLVIPIEFDMDKFFNIKYTSEFMKMKSEFQQYLRLIDGKIK